MSRRLSIVLAVVAVAAAACATVPPAPPAPASPNPEVRPMDASAPTPARQAPLYYALQYSRGPAWDPTRPLLEQPLLDPHVEYMQGLMERGVLLYGGPYTDDTGGMAIVRVATRAEAEAIVAGDPAVKNGLFAPTLKAWRTPFNAIER